MANHHYDVLIIGTGSAGLMTALQLDDHLNIALLAKSEALEGSSYYAQGGISAVLGTDDNFARHIEDTRLAGAGLCDLKNVRFMVENAPAAIESLEAAGVHFTKQKGNYHLTTEGGHSARRVLHVADKTGQSIQTHLLNSIRKKKNVRIFEHHIAVDLLKKNGGCFGAYVFDRLAYSVATFTATRTVLATGGGAKVYLYTSNPDTATGDGIAMAWRAGCALVNMEFTQFHPTCLYHPHAKSFLISEALRGEGAKLSLPNGEPFIEKYDRRGALAPRDIVARAIDNEMKIGGHDYVCLDISFKSRAWLKKHFPTIDEKCRGFGIDIAKTPIPVVPAAHYMCGGVRVDLDAKTEVKNLFAIGEVAHTGVHGANRMASNSLLECIVFGKSCAQAINRSVAPERTDFPPWDASRVQPSREKVLVSHLWDEIRRIMWNYVGIVRSDSRLLRAKKRLDEIHLEVEEYYQSYLISGDLIELRNVAKTAQIIVDSAIKRRESRGLHYNENYPRQQKKAQNTVIKKSSKFSSKTKIRDNF